MGTRGPVVKGWNAEVKNVWISISIHLYIILSWLLLLKKISVVSCDLHVDEHFASVYKNDFSINLTVFKHFINWQK